MKHVFNINKEIAKISSDSVDCKKYYGVKNNKEHPSLSGFMMVEFQENPTIFSVGDELK